MASEIHDIDSIKALTGIAVRTLRHWIRQGIVPKPLGRGPAARYTDWHLLRIRAAQTLRTQGISLRAIRLRLNSLDQAGIAALIPVPSPAPPPPVATPAATTDPLPPATPREAPVPSAMPDYPHEAWHSIELMRGLVLLVDTSHGEVLQRIASDIFKHYGVTRNRA